MTYKDITSGEWLVRTTVDDSGDHPWYEYTVFSYPYKEKRMGHHVICECSTNKADAELIASAPKLLTQNKKLMLKVDELDSEKKWLIDIVQMAYEALSNGRILTAGEIFDMNEARTYEKGETNE